MIQCPLFDLIIYLLDLSLKLNDFIFKVVLIWVETGHPITLIFTWQNLKRETHLNVHSNGIHAISIWTICL